MRFAAPIILLAALALPFPAQAMDLPFGGGAETAAPVPRPVVSMIVSDIPAERRIIPGMIRARTEVMLGFQTLGRIRSREVDLGDRVAAGQVLARLDPEDMDANVRAAEAAVDSAAVAVETSTATAARTRELVQRNVVPQALLEQVQQELASAQAGLQQARSQLVRAQDSLGFATLTAPFDGVISAVHENAGAVVGAGSPVVVLSDDHDPEAVIDLPESMIAALPEDVLFDVWLEGSPEARSQGRIHQIDPQADSATQTRRVHLDLEPSGDFRLGSLVQARRADGRRVLILPNAAVFERDGQATVWVVDRAGDVGIVGMQPVRIAARLSTVVIIGEGLSEGDEVVIRGVNSLTPGQQVGRSVSP